MCSSIHRRWGVSRVQLEAIKQWAETHTSVSEVRVFGSRAKGCARIDSDLDVAVTAADTPYHFFKDRWQRELAEATGLNARVCQYRLDIDGTVKRYCDECSILVYESVSDP